MKFRKVFVHTTCDTVVTQKTAPYQRFSPHRHFFNVAQHLCCTCNTFVQKKIRVLIMADCFFTNSFNDSCSGSKSHQAQYYLETYLFSTIIEIRWFGVKYNTDNIFFFTCDYKLYNSNFSLLFPKPSMKIPTRYCRPSSSVPASLLGQAF